MPGYVLGQWFPLHSSQGWGCGKKGHSMFVTLKMQASRVGGRGDDVMNCNGTAVMIFL